MLANSLTGQSWAVDMEKFPWGLGPPTRCLETTKCVCVCVRQLRLHRKEPHKTELSEWMRLSYPKQDSQKILHDDLAWQRQAEASGIVLRLSSSSGSVGDETKTSQWSEITCFYSWWLIKVLWASKPSVQHVWGSSFSSICTCWDTKLGLFLINKSHLESLLESQTRFSLFEICIIYEF